MNDDIWTWVMHTVNGQTRPIGPYRAENAAGNRRDACRGGEAVLFKSFSSDPTVALDEFKVESIL